MVLRGQMSEDLDPRFKTTKYIVEATHEEEFNLWEKLSNESNYVKYHNGNNMTWKQHSIDQIYTISEVDIDDHTYPINVCFHWYDINDILVCFWEPISMVVHYGLIKKWFKKNIPNIKKYNAANFHHCIKHIKDQNVKKE